MVSKIFRLMKQASWLLMLVLLIMLMIRAYNVFGGPPLQLWHTFVPRELSIAEMNAGDWGTYMKREGQLFTDVRREVTDKLLPETRLPMNRFYSGAIVYPPSFAQNWNRSYVLNELERPPSPTGAVVFLHGLTDAPYSLRHIAKRYHELGFVCIGLRLPGHGTVPAGLSNVTWEEWMAATRLAVRQAKALTSASAPLHLVGFSNGGALAIKYALDALEDKTLARPDRLALISPMIGITRFARFAGLAGLPAVLPAFAKSAWLGIVPEFNPFKYNSFPVNGARQSHRLTIALQQQITRLAQSNSLNDLAPVLTFQSIIDYTVSTPAIISNLYAHLPENGSELVLFDVNQATPLIPLMRSAVGNAVSRILPSPPQRYRITVISNAASNDLTVAEKSIPAGQSAIITRPLGLIYPPQIFSLSHVALPFPMDDPLYGMSPLPGSHSEFGVNLGAMTVRGERGALMVNMDSLFRVSSNPFFPYLLERIEEGIKAPLPRHPATPSTTIFADPNSPLNPTNYLEIIDEATEFGELNNP